MEINKNDLPKEVFEVTQNCGTEPPFSGKLLNEKRIGTMYVLFVRKLYLTQTLNLIQVQVGQVSLNP